MAVPFYSAPVVGCCSTSCIVIEQKGLVILSGLAILVPSLPVVLSLVAFAILFSITLAFLNDNVIINPPLVWVWFMVLIVHAAQVYIGICVLMIGCMGHAEVGAWTGPCGNVNDATATFCGGCGTKKQEVGSQDFAKADTRIGSMSTVDEENPTVGKNHDAVVVSA
jgi:hypothetical protein